MKVRKDGFRPRPPFRSPGGAPGPRPASRTSQKPRASRQDVGASAVAAPKRAAPAKPEELLSGLLGDAEAAKGSGHAVRTADAWLARLEKESFGTLQPDEVGRWVEGLFRVQAYLVHSTNQLAVEGKEPDKLVGLRALQRLADVQTQLFRRGVEMDDARSPSPVFAWVAYKNTFKQPGYHSDALSAKIFAEKARDFIGKGGDFDQIHTLSLDFLNGLASNQLCEWVVDEFDTARISTADKKPSPGHTLLALGRDALAAGSLRLFKDAKGEIEQVFVGTFSGHFRNGRESLHHMVRHLVSAGVPREKIIIHEGEAASFRTLDLVNRLTGVSGAEAQQKATDLVAQVQRWMPFEPVKPAQAGVPAAVEVGARPTVEGTALNEALFAMRQSVQRALEDGVILDVAGEPEGVACAIEKVLVLSEKAGNELAFAQAMALLRHVAFQEPPHIDEGSKVKLNVVLKRWEAHAFGTGAADAADVFSARPVGDRRARIVATVNPRGSEGMFRDMILAGMDVARLSTAHLSVPELREVVARVRAAAAAVGRPISIQVDLAGPKIRLGRFKNPQNLQFNDVFLVKGERVTLTSEEVLGDEKTFPVEYPALAREVKIGDPVLFNDGRVELKVLGVDQDAGRVTAEVVRGGKVWDRKGINLPNTKLRVSAVTPDDVEALKGLVDVVDLVAVSFVSGPEDVLKAKSEMQKLGRILPVIAKIERLPAVDELERIANVADALMVARGDLGVEMGWAAVPAVERKVNAIGDLYGKPTMVATEVFQSMADGDRPTRAEVEAAYSAIHDQGADAIMLAKETSAGKAPAEAVRAAAKVIEKAELDLAAAPFQPRSDLGYEILDSRPPE